MDLVYQTLWDADQAGNGVPAVRPGAPVDEARGYVIVDEPANRVNADFRVLKQVRIPDSKRRTYDLCAELMDNYALERRAREVLRPQELAEETAFVEAILDTPVIQTARQILEERGGVPVPDRFVAAKIRECWFELGTAGSQDEASGFEHVFVGEQASKASKIGGYHYWHKYWLDDGGPEGAGDDRISYLGTKYGGAQRPDQGILVPEVVTLSLEWDAPGGDGSAGRTLSKPIGGFFVGCSPEGLIALGLIRALTESGKIAVINGAEYQLDLHRLDNRRGIRTFFPRFLKAHATAIADGPQGHAQGHALGQNPRPGQGGDTTPAATSGNTLGGADTVDFDRDTLAAGRGHDTMVQGPFRILAAMINPTNPEGGREFLQIINLSAAAASLKDWTVTAPNGTVFTLADQILTPGEVFRFTVPRSDGVLRNAGGAILLHRPNGGLMQTCAYNAGDTRNEGAVVLF